MKVVAIYNRRIERAIDAFTYASEELKPVVVETQDTLEDALRDGKAAVTQDALLLARSPQIDVLVETTGAVEFGAQVCLEAF
jgi:predicted homoserine dehydrogenase-like protein